MEDTQVLDNLYSIVQSIGMWAVFAWLYINERNAHEDTRQRWVDDLRELASLKKPLILPSEQANGRIVENEKV